MTKKAVVKGIIELKQEEMSALQEQIDDNVRQYHGIWKQRNIFLEAAESLKAQELEGKYYYLRDVVGQQLDRKRIELDKETEELLAEAFNLKRGMSRKLSVLEQEKQELQKLKKKHQEIVQEQERAISDSEFTIQQSEQRILELEGSE